MLATLVVKKHALVMRLSAADLGGESMRSLSDLVLETLVAKKKPELVRRLGAGDLGGEKHALDMRLSAATLVSKACAHLAT